MFQRTEELDKRHQKFLTEICQSQKVWTLQNETNYATCFAEEYEDVEGYSTQVICFWSSKEQAQACVISEWKDYKIVSFSLSEFLENWCIGMANDRVVAGTNFNTNMIGKESDPLDLIIEIAQELRNQKVKVTLPNFETVRKLEIQVKQLLGG